MKIGILIAVLLLISCGKNERTVGVPGENQTIDGFLNGYQGQVSRNGLTNKGETVVLQENIRYCDGPCSYDYSYGERSILNANRKLIKIYVKDVWKLASGPVANCGNSRTDEDVRLVPAKKLKEMFVKNVTKKCDYLRKIFGDSAKISSCSQFYQGQTTYRSETGALFKTTLNMQFRGVNYAVVNDATHLYSKYLWVPYPIAQRTIINGKETPNQFNKIVIDYYMKTIDDRDYDHIPVRDYYEGWEL